MAKRKQSSPYTKKATPPPVKVLKKQAVPRYNATADAKENSPYGMSMNTTALLNQLEDDPNTSQSELDIRQDDRVNQLRGLLEPKREMNLKGVSTPIPASPYPFKNPITMDPEIDKSVRELRTRLAPGAGTAKTSILSSNPPRGLLGLMAGGMDTELGKGLMQGTQDEDDLTVQGLVQPTVSGGRNVFINRGAVDKDSTIAHELSHRNDPATVDGWGSYNYEDKAPGAEYVDYLYKKVKERDKFPKGLPYGPPADHGKIGMQNLIKSLLEIPGSKLSIER